MNSNRWFLGKTQVYWTCKALLEGRNINHRMEIREVRGWRLGAIVRQVKRHYAWPIEAEYRGPDNVAHYRLKPRIDAASLRIPRSALELDPKGDAA